MTFQRSPDLVTTTLGEDELVLLHLTTNRYYTLNETGQFIWEALADGHTPDAVTTAVLQRWEAEREEVEQYVAELIDELRAEDLLLPASA
jgi:hypothetical protein